MLNGVKRATCSELHPCLPEATNRWTSRSLPAWIELRWETPQLVSEVHLTFDTGFERELTLTMSDRYNAGMVRGPQPETVKDYRLELFRPFSKGEAAGVLRIRDNYQGRRVHKFSEPLVLAALRLVVEATHGLPEARVFEIRVY